jgi:hypothetical protein
MSRPFSANNAGLCRGAGSSVKRWMVEDNAYNRSPVYVQDNLSVMSIGFMLPSQDDAVIWKGLE